MNFSFKYFKKKILLLNKQLLNNKRKISKEIYLLAFFGIIIFGIFIRLFYLQIIQADYYKKILVGQHFTQSLLKANRGNIFLIDKSGKEIKLTESIELYNLYVDPKFILNKEKVKDLLAPIVYKHFCEIYGLEKPTKIECISNIEKFINKPILKQKTSDFILTGTSNNSGENLDIIGISQSNGLFFDLESLNQENEKIIEQFSGQLGIELIGKKILNLLSGGIRQSNYFGFYDNELLLNDLKKLNYDFIEIENNYIYFIPFKVKFIDESTKKIVGVFKNYGYNFSFSEIKASLLPKEVRYNLIIKNMSSILAKEIKEIKFENYNNKIDGIPLLHGIGLESYEKRFYPYGSFLSHVIGLLDENGDAFYGIEKYFDHSLKGMDGKMSSVSVPWIGAIGSNNIDMKQPIDGSDIYLTIDMNLQRITEKAIKFYYQDLNPDSISIIIMDPNNGKIKAMANYPTFDPNFYKDIYKIKPLDNNSQILITDKSYVDMPILILSGEKLKVASYEERLDPNYKKYMFRNTMGPNIFIDKNIGFPYEPGSIFKLFTLAIGMDSDEISMYDLYKDNMRIEVGPYSINNVHKECAGLNSYLHAIERSCNVGMVRIAEKIKKWTYYNYLEKIGFGKKTGIQLDGEDPGKISANDDFSLARFYNNSFGQGILATPIQMGVGYSAMVNGGFLIQPTIIEKIFDRNNGQFINFEKKVEKRIFKQSVSDKIKEALFKVVSEGDLIGINITGYSLGGKTGTSQIAFKGNYLGGNGWTNSSFVGIVTKNDLRYVLVIQVRRPRTCQWGLCTAGLIFKDLSKILIETNGIKQ